MNNIFMQGELKLCLEKIVFYRTHYSYHILIMLFEEDH